MEERRSWHQRGPPRRGREIAIYNEIYIIVMSLLTRDLLYISSYTGDCEGRNIAIMGSRSTSRQ